MKLLPSNVQFYKKTRIFSESTIPSGLLRNHRLQNGIWGKIIILNGALIYVIQDELLKQIRLTPVIFGVIEPEIPHLVQPEGRVSFYVEFYK